MLPADLEEEMDKLVGDAPLSAAVTSAKLQQRQQQRWERRGGPGVEAAGNLGPIGRAVPPVEPTPPPRNASSRSDSDDEVRGALSTTLTPSPRKASSRTKAAGLSRAPSMLNILKKTNKLTNAIDSTTVKVQFWAFTRDEVSVERRGSKTRSMPGSSFRFGAPGLLPGPKLQVREGCGALDATELPGFLKEQLALTEAELDKNIAAIEALPLAERAEKRQFRHQLPAADTCRWYHMSGFDPVALRVFSSVYRLDPEVVASCSHSTSKPILSHHHVPRADKRFSHLFLVGHYLLPNTDASEIPTFTFEQMHVSGALLVLSHVGKLGSDFCLRSFEHPPALCCCLPRILH